jgi:hypothetical protein
MNETFGKQWAICKRFGANFLPPEPGTRVGIALGTLGRRPLNGLRLPAGPGTCGWFIYAGEEVSDHPDFYSPLCVEHLAECCPPALPFLALPPGWRFLTDGDYIDVWFDRALVGPTTGASGEVSMERTVRAVEEGFTSSRTLDRVEQRTQETRQPARASQTHGSCVICDVDAGPPENRRTAGTHRGAERGRLRRSLPSPLVG